MSCTLYDANLNPKSSLFTIGLTVNGMNPISAFGYRLGVHTNPKIQERIEGLDRSLNSFEN